MKAMTWVGGLAVAILGVAVAAPATPQEPNKGDREKNIQAALERSKPGDHHRRLDVWVGQWDTTWKVWAAPGQAATDVSTGTATFAWSMGGRFLRGRYSGNKMMGVPFEAELTLGYNGLRGQYEISWINSFETTFTTYTGAARLDQGGKLAGFTFTGKSDDCPTGRKDVTYRSEMAVQSNDRIVEEIYGPDEAGKEYKVVEVTYVRKK